MSTAFGFVTRHSWAVWKSGKQNCKTRQLGLLLQAKSLTSECQNCPVEAAGAVVSPGKAGLETPGGLRVVALTGTSHEWEGVSCHALGSRVLCLVMRSSGWQNKQVLLYNFYNNASLNTEVNLLTRLMKIHLWKKALNNQWVLIKLTTTMLRQMSRSWSAGCCSVIHDNPESHSSQTSGSAP